MNEPVIIDPEFQSLIPPLSHDEYKQLEENCKRDGILDSLKVWHGILIDGHNRHRIAEEWDLNYEICEIERPNRDAVKAWIAKNQLGRRNVDDLTKIELARIAKPEIVKEAQKRKEEGNVKGGKSDTKSCPTSRKEKRNNSTAHKLAKAAGMSEEKFRQGETILDSGNQEIIDAVRSGEISVHNGYQQVMREITPPAPKPVDETLEAKKRHSEFKQKTIVSMDDVRQDKKDQKRIARELYQDLRSWTNKGGWIGTLNSSEAFDALVEIIPESEVEDMTDRINDCIIVLTKLKEVLNGKR